MASNTHRHGQGITSGVNLNVFRIKSNPKREIGDQATHPPPKHISNDKVDTKVNNNIEIESESEEEDDDLLHINTISSNNNNSNTTDINTSDIFITDQKEEHKLDDVIFNNVNTVCTTLHEAGSSRGTTDGLNYNYDRSDNQEVSDDDVMSFINITSRINVKGYKRDDGDDGDDFDETASIFQ